MKILFFWILGTIEFIVDFEIFRRAYHHASEFWKLKIERTLIPDISNIDPGSIEEENIIWERNPRPGTSVQVTPQDPQITVFPEIPVTPDFPLYKRLCGLITIVAAVGIDLIVSSYTGAKRRKEMQNYINDCLQPCIKLKHNIVVLDLIIDEIKAFITGIDMMREYYNQVFSEKQLKEMFELFQKKCNEKIKEIDYEKTAKELEEIDKQRGSWTKEG
ncbi:27542_t:CDS:2 [Dentiscutata erythropus]|uniref:27542_t:CDS:1 n=1 Tax=Dentiscutata erythropus TaxID=1348616 RepID=A0A9N9HSP6_9GLOM|nr:27542_t:CDS:2 [Dentiscutata erythropus]